jgi:hypothetical protein
MLMDGDNERPSQEEMTDYSTIDPILMAWARKRGVHVYTRHQDCDVRSIMIAEPSGEQRHMYIDPVDDNGMVGIHAARFDGWRRDRSVSLGELASALDEVFDALISPAGSASS